jgi:LmbE family N-acetylglucosaminyl deacetylase
MDVVYVIVTDGSKGIDDRSITPEQLVSMRRDEQLAAAKILGLKDVVFLGYPDAYVQASMELRHDIVREIRRYKPDVLITLNPTRILVGDAYIGHPDHFAVGEATLSAVYPAARDHLTFPDLLDEGFETHKVREVLIAGHNQPDKWVDVADTIEIAIRALKAHKSQVVNPEAESLFRERKRETGKDKGMEYAESFKMFLLR